MIRGNAPVVRRGVHIAEAGHFIPLQVAMGAEEVRERPLARIAFGFDAVGDVFAAFEARHRSYTHIGPLDKMPR